VAGGPVDRGVGGGPGPEEAVEPKDHGVDGVKDAQEQQEDQGHRATQEGRGEEELQGQHGEGRDPGHHGAPQEAAGPGGHVVGGELGGPDQLQARPPAGDLRFDQARDEVGEARLHRDVAQADRRATVAVGPQCEAKPRPNHNTTIIESLPPL
jgi:hypothetical protein